MPYVRRFYYMPRVTNSHEESDILSPVDNLWKYGATHTDIVKYEYQPGSDKQQSFQDLPAEEQARQLHFKKILGILNKLTPKKFQKLINELRPESVNTIYIRMMAELIFSKALDDEIYLHLYAKFCEDIMSKLSEDLRVCFRNVLYQLCDKGFHSLLATKDSHISAINDDRRYRFKGKFMSLMRFIGEMSFIDDPLVTRQYCLYLTELLIEEGEELHLEAVYYILCTCSLRSNNYVWPEELWMTVSKLSKGIGPSGITVSSRIRFMFLSLVEARIGRLLPDPLPPSSSPPSSDSENNDHMPDLKGF